MKRAASISVSRSVGLASREQSRRRQLGCEIALLAALAISLPLTARGTCTGDCDEDGEVTIEEMIRGVLAALNNDVALGCFDADQNGAVTVEEIVRAANNALFGCPPTPTPTLTSTIKATPTLPPTPSTPWVPSPTGTPLVVEPSACPVPRPAPDSPAVYIEDLTVDTPGEAVLEVKLATGAKQFAGVEHDVLFDPHVRVKAKENGRPDCTVNPEINKPATSFAFLPLGCSGIACTGLRTIVYPLENARPIAEGSVLYRCTVTVAGSGLLVVTNVRGAGPSGQLIPGLAGRDGGFCVRSAPPATPIAAATPTPTVSAAYTPTLTSSRTSVPSPTPTPTRTLPPSTPGICGNGVVDHGEECDDGGICVGTAQAGQACTSNLDCFTAWDEFKGVCVGGEKPETFCSGDNDCPSGECVACRTFGGDGCAANCTEETTVSYDLAPGILRADQTLQPGTSGVVVWGDPLVVSLPLRGKQELTIGKERNGKITAVIKASSARFDESPISTLACACVRGAEYKTCGGAIFYPDGSFTESCTEGFASPPAQCPERRPCAAVFGPGNAASGIFGCQGLEAVNVRVRQDSCAGEPGGPLYVNFAGRGGPGSAVLTNAISIGTSIGPCQPTFCTDLDPPFSRGTPNPFVLTTGQACATVLCKNDDPSYPAEPKCVTGQGIPCSELLQGNLTGLTLGGAFIALGQQTLGDIEVTVQLVAE